MSNSGGVVFEGFVKSTSSDTGGGNYHTSSALTTVTHHTNTSGGGCGSSSQSSAWSKSLQFLTNAVLHHHHQPTTAVKQPVRKESKVVLEDPLGDSLLKLLNRHPAFSGATTAVSPTTRTRITNIVPNNDPNAAFCYPIVSRHNLHVLKIYVMRLLWRLNSFVLQQFFSSGEDERLAFQPAPKSCAIVFLWTLLLGSLSIMTAGHMAIQTVSVWTVQCVATTFVLLFGNVHDIIQHHCPKRCLQAWKQLVDIAHWIDTHLLQAKRFSGREWNQKEYNLLTNKDSEDVEDSTNFFYHEDKRSILYTSSSSKKAFSQHSKNNNSRHKSIWELPPPSVKQGKRLSLSWEHFIAKEEWSRPTVEHMVAVNFCFIMLREDHLRRQASKHKQQNQSQQQQQRPTQKQPTTRSTKQQLYQLQQQQHLASRHLVQNLNHNSPKLLTNGDDSIRPQSSTNTVYCDAASSSIDRAASSRSVTLVVVEQQQQHHHRRPSELKDAPSLIEGGASLSTSSRMRQERDYSEGQAIELKMSDAASDLPATYSHCSSSHNSTTHYTHPNQNLNDSILVVVDGREYQDDEEENYDNNNNSSTRELAGDCLSGDSSVASNLSSDLAADLPWIDVGAKIGMRLLNSAHVHRAMSNKETADRLMNIATNATFDGSGGGGASSAASGATSAAAMTTGGAMGITTSTTTTMMTTTTTTTTTTSPANAAAALAAKNNQLIATSRGDCFDDADFLSPISPISDNYIGTATFYSPNHHTTTNHYTSTFSKNNKTPNNSSRITSANNSGARRMPKPIHSMWTSPGAAAQSSLLHILSDNEDSQGGGYRNGGGPDDDDDEGETSTLSTGGLSPSSGMGVGGVENGFGINSNPASPSAYSLLEDVVSPISPAAAEENHTPACGARAGYGNLFATVSSISSPPPTPSSAAFINNNNYATSSPFGGRRHHHHHHHDRYPHNDATVTKSRSDSRDPMSPRRPLSVVRAQSADHHHPVAAVPEGELSPPRIKRFNHPTSNHNTPTRGARVPTSPYAAATAGGSTKSAAERRRRHHHHKNHAALSAGQRQPLAKGVKVAVPIFPIQPKSKGIKRRWTNSQFQMGTVVSSKRIYAGDNNKGGHVVKGGGGRRSELTNCLSVTVKLDRAYLRNADFAEMTFRVMDEWAPRYMPKCSKVPIGSCIATTFGVGVLVGWRVEDDCHVVRSLWQRRGKGSAHAYLNRDAIHSTLEAAVGFDVDTKFGLGVVIAYVDGGKTFQNGRFFVAIKEEGRHHGHVLGIPRKDILSCYGAQFIPIIEHIREAATYQILLDTYQSAVTEQQSKAAAAASRDNNSPGGGGASNSTNNTPSEDEKLWKQWSSYAEIIWNSFLKAVEEDRDFDEGMNEFMTSVIDFLEKLDEKTPAANEGAAVEEAKTTISDASEFEVECIVHGEDGQVQQRMQQQQQQKKNQSSSTELDPNEQPGFWLVNDILGGVFRKTNDISEKESNAESAAAAAAASAAKAEQTRELERVNYELEIANSKNYKRAFALIRTLMKTVSVAQAASVDHPHFRLALAISYEFLVFVRTLLKVQRKNLSVHSFEIWKRALGEIALTFGPLKDRLEKIGRGIAQRMEKQGRKAKIRVIQFVDIVLGDEKLLFALEQGEWDQCIVRLEIALVKSKIVPEESLFYYRKTAQFVYDHLRASATNTGSAADRNNEKLAMLAQAVQSIASPRRSILKLFRRDDVLELFERILVRVFCKEEKAARTLTIHAANFHSLRHFRMLKNFSVAGGIWIPLLDAADEEFSWLVSHMPENSKEFMCPLSSLFSLCVSQFHKIGEGDLSKDWLDFLLEDDAVRIVQELNMKLIVSLESFSRDLREMMVVLPYYPSIDDDILNLMDEIDLDEFLKEASAAIDDPNSLSQFLREKATNAVERFLNYLPKMSIPVERRDLGEGWVLTCHGEDGGDLTLSDVKIQRENLVCQILGGDTLFFPMFSDDDIEVGSNASSTASAPRRNVDPKEEESILDHIRVLLVQAQSFGCWKQGLGGVGPPPSDRYVAAVLQGIPVSSVLNCAIELWRNLEIDDDELLEIAIRDISFQIQIHSANGDASEGERLPPTVPPLAASDSSLENRLKISDSHDSMRRFNPRVDPTVLFLEMKKLTLRLDKFRFCIEKSPRQTIFDPIFQGQGMVSLQNVSIRLRVDCAKEKVKKSSVGPEVSTPILQIRELHVELEKMQLKVKDTGFGSDWLLNRAVNVFADSITKVVEENLRDQILEQSRAAIDNLNAYFLVNPNMLLNLLGISMDDLEENVVWV